MSLNTDNNLGIDADDAYAALLEAHRHLTPEQSQRLNARLVLILMNQVGELDIINQAIAAACNGLLTDTGAP